MCNASLISSKLHTNSFKYETMKMPRAYITVPYTIFMQQYRYVHTIVIHHIRYYALTAPTMFIYIAFINCNDTKT